MASKRRASLDSDQNLGDIWLEFSKKQKLDEMKAASAVSEDFSSDDSRNSAYTDDEEMKGEEMEDEGLEEAVVSELNRVSLKDELEFVIHTRDNNKPNPWGTHSTTYGPLSHSEVASLYNIKYGKKVGATAVGKRYLSGYKQYCDAHPEYPRKIHYAEKPEGWIKPKEKSVKPTRRLRADRSRDEDDDSEDSDEQTSPTRKSAKETRAYNKYGYGALKPPASVTEAADMDKYFEARKPIRADEYATWITLVAEDRLSRTAQCGSVDISLAHIRQSSRLCASYLEQTTGLEICIVDIPKRIIELYASTISPVKQMRLPDYYFTLRQYFNTDKTIEHRPVVSRMEWIVTELTDLYALATQLEDDHVRNLVMNHLSDTCRDEDEIEIDEVVLNKLFNSTERYDRCRAFWIHVLHEQGMAEVIVNGEGFHPDLIEGMNTMLRRGSPEYAPWKFGLEDFCTKYHFHAIPATACQSAATHDYVDHSIDYGAIAQRVLQVALRKAYEEAGFSSQELKVEPEDLAELTAMFQSEHRDLVASQEA
jgi:hypothetical protein